MKIKITPSDGKKKLIDIINKKYPQALNPYTDYDRVQILNFHESSDLYVTIGRENLIFGDGNPIRAGFGEFFTVKELYKMYPLTDVDNAEIEISIRNLDDLIKNKCLD